MFPRKLEKFYEILPFIAEFWNTISNLPFVMIGILRLIEGTPAYVEYTLYILIGFGSFIHHATPQYWTIVIDYIPIFSSIYYFWKMGYFYLLSWANYFQLGLAFVFLLCDHILVYVRPPWGHVFWHVLVAVSIDGGIQEVCRKVYFRRAW